MTAPPPDIPRRLLLDLLRDADETAARRVVKDDPPPGPFGAAMYFYNARTGECLPCGGVDSNRVNAEGPGAHAESVNLSAEGQARLRSFLEARKGGADWTLLFVSTAESCLSCYAKQQIVAGGLIVRGLVGKDRVLSVFGADYADTLAVAGFSDEILLAEMRDYPWGGGLMKFETRALSSYPPDVAAHLAAGAAVVHDGRDLVAAGYDGRGSGDALSTAETEAVRSAFRARLAQGAAAPWNLSGLVLASATDLRSAPLARSTAFWASLSLCETVEGAPPPSAPELPGMENARLYEAVIARPYNGPAALMRVMRVAEDGAGRRFENRAQKAWAVRRAAEEAKGRIVHYDGGASG